MKDKYYLYLSNRTDKKYVMLMPSHNHIHHFGASGYRDFTLMNDKSSKHYESNKAKREQIKDSYHKRHASEKGGRHSASSMSKIILWNKDTLLGGIKDYEKKYNVEVVFNNRKLTDAIKKKMI